MQTMHDITFQRWNEIEGRVRHLVDEVRGAAESEQHFPHVLLPIPTRGLVKHQLEVHQCLLLVLQVTCDTNTTDRSDQSADNNVADGNRQPSNNSRAMDSRI